MRQFEPDFAAHIASGATTLATCWRIVRRDGRVLGFTDHDEAILVEDTPCLPAHGLDGAAATARLGAQVDSGEVLGILHAEAITEDDIALGFYRDALVETWRVNWRQPGQRALLRRDWIGEIVREDGRFRAELRSGQRALGVARGRIYSALCNAALGDAACGVDLDDPALRAEAEVLGLRDRFRLEIGGLGGFAEDWFALGQGRWHSGRRAGKTDRVQQQARIGGADILAFDAPVGDWAAPGDSLVLTAGCDRRFATCGKKFGNGLNFRGFPHIPGADFVLRYPKSGQVLDGRPVLK